MKNDFDLNRIGKRMPYKIPDGFFNEMETKLWEEVKQPVRHRTFRLRSIIVGITAAAASVTLLFVLNPYFDKKSTNEFLQVEQAFANLSHEDQTYLLEVYQEDVFINE